MSTDIDAMEPLESIPSPPPAPAAPRAPWTVEDSKDLYLIDRWGAGFFDVNAKGELIARPLRKRTGEVVLTDVLHEALSQGLRAPLLVRFQDMLHYRVRQLNNAFIRAIAENKYRGAYRGVYPIKVNQLREVLEEILDAGKAHHYCLYVSSNPECFAGLFFHADPEGLLVFNGFQVDHSFLTALIGRKLRTHVTPIH